MKRTLCTLALLLALTPAASAQEHQHQHPDTTKAMPMEHGGMMDHDGMMSMEDMQAMMPQMMQMHERMMADSAMHRMMMADPEMRQMMHEMMQGDPMMGGDHDMAAMRERMAALSPDERRQKMQQMHERMMERMQAMSPEEREAMMQRMMGMHQKMMADPAMRERMMADPEMRQMMEGMKERMKEGGMMPGGMDHDRMEGMDHSRMEGMEHGQMSGMQHGPMSADAARAAEAASRTADRFYTALTAGDRAVVESLLLPDAVVLEGGKAEARAEYLGHHFGSDIAFLASVEREPLTRTTDVAGDAAWVASTSRVSGAYEGRTLDLDSAELLVLRHDAAAPDGWRIAAVHWSSASRE
jgi:hypothetical protein